MRRAAATLALLALACGAPGPAPYEVERPAAVAALRSVAVLPVASYPELFEGEAAGFAAIEAGLRAELERRGLAAVPADYEGALAALARERGVDLRPGYAAPVELERLQRDAVASVRRETGADAILVPSIVVRSARLSGVHATWDGRAQDITWRAPGEHNARLSRAYRGEVGAASLRIELLGSSGERLYAAHGGLHVLSRIGSYMEELPVPVDEILLPSRIEKAAEAALGGLGRP